MDSEKKIGFPAQSRKHIYKRVFGSLIAHLVFTLELRDYFSGSWLRQPYTIFTIEQSNIHKASMVILRHGAIELSSV